MDGRTAAAVGPVGGVAMADGRWSAVGRLWGGGALILVAAFMLLGFLVSGGPLWTWTNLIALLVSVGIPGVTGGALVASHFRGDELTARREALRLETIEAEVIRLAGRHDGRLTAVEVAGELGVPAEEAKRTLDALMLREVADLEVTESGVLVYAFHDVRHLEDKAAARPLLEDAPDRGFELGGDPRRESRSGG